MPKTIKDYFKVQELVCPHILQRYAEVQIWSFIDPRLLETLLLIREKIKKPIVINNSSGYTQRGLRCNCCQIVKDKTNAGSPYLSAHVRGTGVDFHVTGMTAEQVRKFITTLNLPYKIRLEKDVTWVHLDMDNFSGEPIQYF